GSISQAPARPSRINRPHLPTIGRVILTCQAWAARSGLQISDFTATVTTTRRRAQIQMENSYRLLFLHASPRLGPWCVASSLSVLLDMRTTIPTQQLRDPWTPPSQL